MFVRTLIVTLIFLTGSGALAILDQNANQQSDIWETAFGAVALNPSLDTDRDGFNNLQESIAGTNPLDANSAPKLEIAIAGADISAGWSSILGKRYTFWSNDTFDPATWQMTATLDGTGAGLAMLLVNSEGQYFFRLQVQDLDSDTDGLTDAEEYTLGFNPNSSHTERYDQTDLQRVNAGWNSSSTITAGVIDANISERWPDKGVIAIRRSGGMKPLTVNLALGGSATSGLDYTSSVTNSIVIPAGAREVWVEITPLADADDAETTETVSVTVQTGTGYSVGNPSSGTVNLANESANGLPNAKAAARFLLQAAFGPDQDSSGDADDIPENVEEVMSLGYSAWIEDQFTRPIGYIQPWVDWAAVNASGLQLYGNWKEFSWWSRAMGAPKLRPDDANTVAPDPLRQRVAFALSEILVASDRPEALAVEQRGMANFYDLFEQHAFGNYRNLLQAVALHPVMGIYLSHLGNQKANPATNVFPDENFAREIMQLFSIGLWELNPDGTRQLDGEGQPIPTYDNGDITELARVFTGLSFGNNTNFSLYPRDFTVPMKGWDAYHDLAAKTLLGGLVLPARTASPGNTGTATMADVTAAVDNLFNHPNVGPFIAYRLIQRLVTSNPSSEYVGRVAAVFANNGSGVRGDMKAVIKAILLDSEARDPATISQPTWGKLREPFLRCVNLARAFNATSPSGHYPLDQFSIAHLQDPMNSPSVFNFFLPNHSPSGPLAQLGLTAPEFQIINAASAVSGANYFWDHIMSDLQYWGAGNANYAVRLNLNAELAMVTSGDINANVPIGALDPDPLLRRLDLVLTGGTLPPQQFQIIREAMLRIGTGTWQWHRERLRMAIYLITTSADFNVLR
ncbi:MAG TPA: DUF1800 family protein [Chthoniobacterales bacterium]|nr:DUF1800 family protein [Chthoniobacterales bacterium]